MRNRSELREIIMKVLYQINIYNDIKAEYDINDLIHEQLEVENSFVTDTVNGVVSNRKEIIQVKSTRLKEYKNKNKIPFSFHNIRTNNYINETLKSIK